jgi:hypothetical protein
VPLSPGWIDAITQRANLPQLTDIGGGLIVFNNCTCSDYSLHAFRRFPIPYQMFGRERRYKVEDVVAYARRRLDEAPVRTPAPRPRPKRICPRLQLLLNPLSPRPNARRFLFGCRRTLLSVCTSLEIHAKKFPKPRLNAEKPAAADGLSAIGKSRPV